MNHAKRLAAAIAILFLFAGSGRAQYWSVGPKFGWRLSDGVFAAGFEVSYLNNYAPGYTFDATCNTELDFNFHLGAEFPVSMGLGLDVGPSVLITGAKPYLGISIIPFYGLLAYAFYEWQYFPAMKNRVTSTFGFYIKLPINPPSSLFQGAFATTKQARPARN